MGSIAKPILGMWLAFMLAANYLLAGSLRQAWAARAWPTSLGQVVSSEVKVRRQDGATYLPVVHFRYQVGGTEYQGHRSRFTYNFTTKHWAAQEVAQRPPGSPVQVYYNPDHPEESVLDPCLRPQDAVVWLVLLPFNLIGFGLLLPLLLYSSHPCGFPTFRNGPVEIILVQSAASLLKAWLPLFVISFGLVFFNGWLCQREFGWSTVAAQYALLAAVGIQGALGAWRHQRNPEMGLQWDRLNRRLRFPGGDWLAWNQVQSFDVQDVEGVDSDGDTTHQYWIRLQPLGQLPERQVQAHSQASADKLVAWLNGQLEFRRH